MNRHCFLLLVILFYSPVLFAQKGNELAINSNRTSSNKSTVHSTSLSSNSNSESWEFYLGLSQEFSAEEQAEANHTFGGKVGCMLQLVKSLYFTREQIVPGDPQTRIVLKKPAIYKALTNIQKDLKKKVKKGIVPLNQARENFIQVLNVALAAVDTESTISFEDALQKNRKNADAQLSLFYKVKVKSIY
ncbi:hypothetical protein [uncultured Bacteroides sp.]|uniref:hypothetical protein n=1 Tax=uncultured Bacteroides sp. TaxID=162156 RepID=UPI002AAB6AD2|nr:hypothetical protein [uncultured Bacteroides sp.]